MNEISDNTVKEFVQFFSERNFEKSRRFHQLHAYNPEPLKLLLDDLGNPQDSYKTIHIAGTTGKGSTATYLARAIQVNFRTGLFTSPHYEKINERIVIDGKTIDNEEFRYFWKIIQGYESVRKISYFDALTAISMLYFREKNVEWAVFETGLGGRFDSTNVIQPEFCIITEIGMDHQNILGNTIQEIAYEKAGIIKSKVPVYASVQNPLAKEVLNRICDEVGSKLYFFKNLSDKNYLSINLEFVQWIYKSHFKTPMPEIKKELVGRIDVLNFRPLTIFDSAHNMIAFKELIRWLNKQETDEWNVYLNLMKERSLADAIDIFRKESLKKINIYLFPFDDTGYYQNSDISSRDQIIVINPNDFNKYLSDVNVAHLITGSLKLYSPLKQILADLNSPSFQRSAIY